MSYQEILDKGKLHEQALIAHEAESKTHLKYGLLRISERRFAVIEYDGCGQHTAGDRSHQAFDLHRFKFVQGLEKVSYEVAIKQLQNLMPHHDWV